MRNAVRVESNRNAIRFARGCATAASLSSVPLDPSASAKAALISSSNGSSGGDADLKRTKPVYQNSVPTA